MGTIETRQQRKWKAMGYAIYIGTISAMAYSLLNTALSAMGV
jgi:hypothetical protein